MGLERHDFSISPLDLNGMWFSEDQRANILRTHIFKKRLDSQSSNTSITTLQSIKNTTGKTYVCSPKK